MRIFTYIIFVILVILGITFAGLNSQTVIINYYINTAKLPLSLLVALTLVIGAILGLMVGFFFYLKIKAANRRLRQRLNLIEKEVANLRAMPLKDDH